nr:TPA_asm: hypothetical protein HUJ06_010909 [Nelumbo nucifera]
MKERLCLEVERLGMGAVIMGSRGFGASNRTSKGHLGSGWTEHNMVLHGWTGALASLNLKPSKSLLARFRDAKKWRRGGYDEIMAGALVEKEEAVVSEEGTTSFIVSSFGRT